MTIRTIALGAGAIATLLLAGACTTIEPEGAPPFKANTAPGTFNTPRTERKTAPPPVESAPEAEETDETVEDEVAAR